MDKGGAGLALEPQLPRHQSPVQARELQVPRELSGGLRTSADLAAGRSAALGVRSVASHATAGSDAAGRTRKARDGGAALEPAAGLPPPGSPAKLDLRVQPRAQPIFRHLPLLEDSLGSSPSAAVAAASAARAGVLPSRAPPRSAAGSPPRVASPQRLKQQLSPHTAAGATQTGEPPPLKQQPQTQQRTALSAPQHCRSTSPELPPLHGLLPAVLRDSSSAAAAHRPHKQQQQVEQQQPPGPSTAAAQAPPLAQSPAARLPAPSPCLHRPLDPAAASYYWHPAEGGGTSSSGGGAAHSGCASDGKAGPSGHDPGGPASNGVTASEFEVVIDTLSPGGPRQMPTGAPRAPPRRTLLIRLPPGGEAFKDALPAVVEDRSGRVCLLVLPSDRPAARSEALDVAALLAALQRDPQSAARRACEWRAGTLARACAGGLAALAAAVRGGGAWGCWRFRLAERQDALGTLLLPGPDEALTALLNSSTAEPEAAAARIALLADPKEAVSRTSAAAATAAEAAAAAADPLPPGSRRVSGGSCGAAGAGAAAAAAAAAAALRADAASRQQGVAAADQNLERGGLGSGGVLSSDVADSPTPGASPLEQQQPEEHLLVTNPAETPGTPVRPRPRAPSPLRVQATPRRDSGAATVVQSAAASPVAVPGAAVDQQHSSINSHQGLSSLPAPQDLDAAATAAAAAAAASTTGDDAGADAARRAQLRVVEGYGLVVGAAVAAADLVRQLEVHCSERGAALAAAWNASVAAAEGAAAGLRAGNDALRARASALATRNEELAREFKAVEFLRREAVRFRRGMEGAEQRAAAAEAEGAALRARVAVLEADVKGVEAFTKARLARLRWRNALATMGTWSRESTVQSGGIKPGPGALLKRVQALEALTIAVLHTERRKAAFGRAKQPEQYGGGAPRGDMSTMVQVVTQGQLAAIPGRSADGYLGADASVQMLMSLTPEARTMALAAMPPDQRWRILEAMRDEERTELVVRMSLPFRAEARAALSPRLWERTMDAVRGSPAFGARYLSAMDIGEATTEFLTWGLHPQAEVLGALDAFTAAAILARVDVPLRKELLSMMDPGVAANIVQSMMPPPAAESLDSLDLTRAVAILAAMDPAKAAEVLAQLGAVGAASKLAGMDPEARASIIESMAPRDAAGTLVSLDGAMQAHLKLRTEASEDGGFSEEEDGAESPVAGAIAGMAPAAALSVLGYMTVQDKAALLASMDPAAVARLLALMDPREAVVLLAALGEPGGRLAASALPRDERDKLLKMLQEATSAPSSAGKTRGARCAGGRRGAEETAARIVAAYEALEEDMLMGSLPDSRASTMDEAPSLQAAQAARAAAAAAAAGQSKGSKARATPSHGGARRAAGTGGSASGGAASGPGAGAGASAAPVSRGGTAGTARGSSADSGIRRGTTGSAPGDEGYGIGLEEEMIEEGLSGEGSAASGEGMGAAAALEAGGSGAASGAAVSGAKAAGARTGTGGSAATGTGGRRQAAGAAGAAASGRGASGATAGAEMEPALAAGASRDARGQQQGGARPKKRPSTIGVAASAAGAGPSGTSRGVGVGSPLPLGQLTAARSGGSEGSEPGASGEGSPALLSERRLVGEDESAVDAAGGSSSSASPRSSATPAAATATLPRASPPGGARKPARTSVIGAAPGAAPAAAGRHALREALRAQAAKARRTVVAASAAAAFADDGAGGQGGGGGQSAGPAAAEQEAQPPQAKLGRLPKNARLIEAMAQHRNAKPKPKGWLLAVVDSIYKEGETLLRKLGRFDMVRKQSVPEIVFAYFHNKYGQRALVNENVGSLVNTLTLHKTSDLRLEAFARLLSEEWDVGVFADFLTAMALALQPAKVVCIEYPRDPAKDEQYAWVCLYKAVYVADTVLGARTQAARDRFNEQLQAAAQAADDADVDRLQRERREALAKEGRGGGGDPDMPERFYRMPRIRFMLLLCQEIFRINRFLAQFAEDRFGALDGAHSGRLPIVAVRGFVKAVCPGSEQQVSDAISQFVAAAESHERDVPPESVSVAGVSEVSRDAFVAAVGTAQMVRDAIKAGLLPAAVLEGESAQPGGWLSLLAVATARHHRALAPFWARAAPLAAGGPDGGGGDAAAGALQKLAAAAAAAGPGDARFRAYGGLLLGLINAAAKASMESSLSGRGLAGDAVAECDQHAAVVEQHLCRLEDAALLLLQGVPYLLAEPSKDLADARLARAPGERRAAEVAQRLAVHRALRVSLQAAAAAVLQSAWRQWAWWQRRRAVAAGDQAGQELEAGGAEEAAGTAVQE